ncbi:hypothetical protein Tco_0822730 [Tanacetum coccineum]|uniref:Uncharacterized protein n=1 Tax=Tanacetum coccineum TaxID=301880 RepID=A0ABQ5AK23_9ASTR
MPLQDPTWHMDTGASSHLNFNASNLSTIFDKRVCPSVHIGDGKSIPVTNTGHSIIPSHHRPLHLHNVLDYLTCYILLRCDSLGDLNPLTKPSTFPTAFLLTSASTWHQRLRYLAFVDSRVESIERFLNRFANQPNETNINDPESDDGSVDTPRVSPFPHFDNDSDDEEVLNELSEYENERTFRRERIINSFNGDDLTFECMIGFRNFTAYLDPFLPTNIISRKAYNAIMVDRLEGTGTNLVAIVKDVYVFVRSFTYIADFVMLEDIGEFIMSDMAEVLMGRPFRKITKLKYDVAKGLVLFTKIFDTYTYRMPRTIPRLKNFNWSKVPPLLELSQNDLMNGFRHPYEKFKFMYKNCLNLGLEYQVNESIKEWLIRGHARVHEVM